MFEQLDKRALRPVPTERYQYGDWETHRVNIDYHVAFDNHWYSVPYQMVQQEVEVRATAAIVEVFHRGVRVASHARSSAANKATTVDEHRPKAHQRYLEWTPSRLVDWAQTIGPATADVFEKIMASKRHPEQGYRSCLGILRLGKEYSPARLEAACPPRSRAASLQLSKREIDSEVQSGQPRRRARRPAQAAAQPPQHPRLIPRGLDGTPG